MSEDSDRVEEVAKELLRRGCTTAPGLNFKLKGTVRRVTAADGTTDYVLATGKDVHRKLL